MDNNVFKKRLEELGYKLNDELVSVIQKKLTDLLKFKKIVNNDDLRVLVQETIIEKNIEREYLIKVKIVSYHRDYDVLSAKVILSQKEIEFEGTGSGNGPIASVWAAVIHAVSKQKILSDGTKLREFDVNKGPGGVEAEGLVTISIEKDNKIGYGRGFDTDIVLAFAKALVSAINNLLFTP